MSNVSSLIPAPVPSRNGLPNMSNKYRCFRLLHRYQPIYYALIEMSNVSALIPAPVPSRNGLPTPNTREDIDSFVSSFV